MKRYNITYQHITGAIRVNSYNELFDFYLRLGELMEDECVTNSSISFYTEEVQVEKPEFVSYPASKEEVIREADYLRFKAYKK